MSQTHIVVTTDFSADSYLAFEPAANLARQLQARLTVLHVVPDLKAIPHGAPLAPPQSDPELSDMEREAREQLAALRSRFPPDLEVALEVVAAENVGPCVNEYATSHAAAFLVIASHGKTGIKGILLGSVAEAVLRKAAVPVLIIPADPERAKLNL